MPILQLPKNQFSVFADVSHACYSILGSDDGQVSNRIEKEDAQLLEFFGK